jgi:hypothetical protein
MKVVAQHLSADLGLEYDLEHLGPPRNLTHLENYLQRSEWQYFRDLIADLNGMYHVMTVDPGLLRR